MGDSLLIVGQLMAFGLVWGGLYAILAMGLNLIYGVMKILNIAHGELLMLGGYIAFWLFTLWQISPLASVPLAALVLFALGLVINRLVVEPIVKVSRSIDMMERATLIAFFGVLLVIQNGALLIWSGDYRVISYLTQSVSLLGVSASAGRLVVFATAMLVAVLMHLFLTRTFLGKAIRAMSQDREVALLMSIDARRVGLISFGIGSALAGIAGVLAGLIYVITPTLGLMFTLKAFTVLVVGGLGSMGGALLAGLGLGIAESLGSFLLGEGYKKAIDYVVLVIVILLLSYGWGLRRV